MKRWALVFNNVCFQVVEQPTQPTITGKWVEVTGVFMGPGWQWDGTNWLAPEVP